MTNEHSLNLIPHRSAASVWDRPRWTVRPSSDRARYALALTAGALTLQGLRQRSAGGALFAAVGCVLIWKTLSEAKNPWESLRNLTHRFGPRQNDVIHEASTDSFPASDAPSWTPVAGSAPRPHIVHAR